MNPSSKHKDCCSLLSITVSQILGFDFTKMLIPLLTMTLLLFARTSFAAIITDGCSDSYEVCMNASLDRHAEHLLKRDTAFGRWMPVILYSVNVGGALATAVAAGPADLMYLAVFPLLAVILYVWRTAKEQP